MPQTARPTRNRNMSLARGTVPRGISATSEDLSEAAVRSFGDFYASSEALSYYPHSFPLDTASVVEKGAREFLKDTLAKLKNLLTLKAGWNGYDSLAPDRDAVVHAENWIVRLYLEAAELGRPWIKPNVIADAEGEVVFEWWYGKKKLTVYIGDESAEYIQVRGPDRHSEMSDGDAEPISVCRSLWLWLTS